MGRRDACVGESVELVAMHRGAGCAVALLAERRGTRVADQVESPFGEVVGQDVGCKSERHRFASSSQRREDALGARVSARILEHVLIDVGEDELAACCGPGTPSQGGVDSLCREVVGRAFPQEQRAEGRVEPAVGHRRVEATDREVGRDEAHVPVVEAAWTEQCPLPALRVGMVDLEHDQLLDTG
jgi:hypothetical protein